MEQAMRVEEVLNQSPPYVDIDLYASDRPLADAVAANGGARDAAALSAFGRHWGSAEMFELARAANEYPPQLKAFDPKGFRRDRIEFHPTYHQFMAESIATGLAASTHMKVLLRPSVTVAKPRCSPDLISPCLPVKVW